MQQQLDRLLGVRATLLLPRRPVASASRSRSSSSTATLHSSAAKARAILPPLPRAPDGFSMVNRRLPGDSRRTWLGLGSGLG